jgi:hypothetical protein
MGAAQIDLPLRIRPGSGSLENGAVPLFAILGPAILVLAVFGWNVAEYRFLGDDAFISFRYAKHLVDGHGLVWNPGEPVEGYTNFLWVLLMASSMWFGLPVEVVSQWIGIASGACVIAMVLWAGLRSMTWKSPLIWVAPLALASSRTFTAWSTGGLETMFFVLVVYLAYWCFFHERRRDISAPFASSLLFAAAALTRPEGNLFALVAGGALLIDVQRGRRSVPTAIRWVVPFVTIVAAHAIWRYGYYGAWLPNTFYAKVPGLWWEQGARYLSLFMQDYRFIWFVPLLVPSLILRPRFETLTAATAAVLYVLYVASVGGDRFEFRFLVVLLPLAYALIADSLFEVRLLATRRGLPTWLSGAVVAAVAVGFIIATHRGSSRWGAQPIRYGVASVRAIAQYAERRTEEGRFLRTLIDRGALPKDLVLAVSGAGAVPYYTEWPTVDVLGLNDAEIAKMPIEERGIVAHERQAPYAYLVRRKVVIFDVLNQLVWLPSQRRVPPPNAVYRGQRIAVRRVRAQDHELAFATTLSDDELAPLFAPLAKQR